MAQTIILGNTAIKVTFQMKETQTKTAHEDQGHVATEIAFEINPNAEAHAGVSVADQEIEVTDSWPMTDRQASNWEQAILAKIEAGEFRRLR